jgi:hypothetical protein
MMAFGMMEGVVVDTNDPQQMGRVKIWVPAIDGELFEIQDLPWATYMSPLAGQTRDYPAGPESRKTSGFMSYGMWTPPKNGALVVVGFLYNDANRRVYLGSYFRDHGNRSLPTGRNRSDLASTPVSDTFEPVEPQTTNLKAQFQDKLTAPEARTRGAYERAVAQDKTEKDGTEGYQLDLIEPASAKKEPLYDPQTYTWTTPGRHSIIMQDHPDTGRMRLKTAAGHQVILDDANERIYVSTAKGNTWLELDQDGRVHLYGADSISISTGGDFNVTAVGDLNLNAGGNVGIQAGAAMRIAGCAKTSVSGNGLNLESAAEFSLKAGGDMKATAPNIHLNGPGADAAECPEAPSVIPTHEPWTRVASKLARGPKWKA